MFKKYEDIILNNPLFKGFTVMNYENALKCLNASIRNVPSNSTLFSKGDEVNYSYIILEGEIEIGFINEKGNKTIISKLCKGELFAEALNCSKQINKYLDINTTKNSILLKLNLPSPSNNFMSNCPHINLVLINLVGTLASKTVFLNNKIQMFTSGSLRDKLLFLFETIKEKQNSSTINLKFSRSELANLVYADRSAVSRELSKMHADGVIKIDKNIITLL